MGALALTRNTRTLWRCRLRAITACIGLALIFTFVGVKAEGQTPSRFNLVPASDPIAACLPNASADVTVFPREEIRGVDTLDLKVGGLLPNTTFAVFLTELPVAPFGAVQYVGDFTTNSAGNGSMRVDAIIQEAFSSQVVGTRIRKELNHMVFWFADPAADEVCVAGSGPTPFDGDGSAGLAAMSSRHLLPGAPLP
jgi:hypothetical protein